MGLMSDGAGSFIIGGVYVQETPEQDCGPLHLYGGQNAGY